MNRTQSRALKLKLAKGVKVWCTHCERYFTSHKTQSLCPICGHVFTANIVFDDVKK